MWPKLPEAKKPVSEKTTYRDLASLQQPACALDGVRSDRAEAKATAYRHRNWNGACAISLVGRRR